MRVDENEDERGDDDEQELLDGFSGAHEGPPLFLHGTVRGSEQAWQKRMGAQSGALVAGN